MRGLRILLTLFLGVAAPAAMAATDAAKVCDAVAAVAAQEAGLPPAMLLALTRTETGRARGGKLTPWPWTVNMEGVGRWFEDRDAALAYARKHHARGARSFDVGCFQINYRWHGEAFSSIESMFDPNENALYAARFLSKLYDEFGNWETAAGAYHSRTKQFADRYKARFRQIRAGIDQDEPSEGRQEHVRTSGRGPGSLINSDPNGHSMPGSLVSLPDSRSAALIVLD